MSAFQEQIKRQKVNPPPPPTTTTKRILTKERILTKLDINCFRFDKRAKGDQQQSLHNQRKEDSLGLDLSDLQVTAISDTALLCFTKLRRLSLKDNFLETLPTSLPNTITFLDLTNNVTLNNLNFLTCLPALTTLLLGDCPKVGNCLDLGGSDFAACKNLKVLVLDRCELKGTINLTHASFAENLDTLVVSHNDIEKIDLKSCKNLKKLSASNNTNLKKIKHVPDRCIAEIRLANCSSLESLKFLSRTDQHKLALLDLSFSPLVNSWKELKSVLNVHSLLTLSLKGTPLRASYTSREEYEKACFASLNCRKLRTLDFAKLTIIPSEHIASDVEDSDGEQFEDLLNKKLQGEEEELNEQRSADNNGNDDAMSSNHSEPAQSEEEDVNEDNREVSDLRQQKTREDDGLFLGQSSSW
jgi:hypothetical protein